MFTTSQFPGISHINDVLPSIRGRKEFIVAEREEYTVVNYILQTPDTFSIDHSDGYDLQAYIRRECRGITFYKDGEIASRKFHKFFNVNEREETLVNNLPTLPYKIMTKLDGSMITPFLRPNGKIQFHTKMGATDVAAPVDDYARLKKRLVKFCEFVISQGRTPIFEWTSPINRIVIKYTMHSLCLLAVRDNITGQYHDLNGYYGDLAETFDVDVVENIGYNSGILTEKFIEDTRQLKDLEGYVVQYEDGRMVKIKAEDYVARHRAADIIQHEKRVWELILSDDVDDLKSFLVDEYRESVEKFERELWEQIELFAARIESVYSQDFAYCDHSKGEESVRKELALMWKSYIIPHLLGIMFKRHDGGDARELVVAFIRKNIKTQEQVDGIRTYLNNVKYGD